MNPGRITIWGNSGSGKSTLAELAGRELGLPVFHLDLIAWAPGWRFRAAADFDREQRDWLAQPRWLIEGVGGWAGLLERFRRAELIVHLDTPLAVCQERAARRLAEDQVAKNRFMADGCRYGDVVDRQAEIIRHFAGQVRSDIASVLASDCAAIPQLRLDGALPPADLCARLVAAVAAS